MKILIDMNMSPRWVEALVENGIDAVHWSSLGHAATADSSIMDHAAKHGYIVMTRDLDFSTILAATGGMEPSVVQFRAIDRFSPALVARVVPALKRLEKELRQGAVLVVTSNRFRLRPLPLASLDSE
jgi:predicted nuclease of predicted toxin-antitoxin system